MRKQPLFPGDSEWQQLLHIFKLLGTPNENVWPGVSRLRDWCGARGCLALLLACRSRSRLCAQA